MKTSGEIASLTGLRGVAAVLIVITHYWAWTSVTDAAALPAAVTPWTVMSPIGMAIFFTLSGYVIALNYSRWDWRDRPIFNLIRLFFYRFARLYPAYIVFVVLVVLRFPDLQKWDDESRAYLVPHLLLAQAWLPIRFGGVLAPDSHFNVSWSLSVECALYVMFGVGAIVAAVLPAWRFKTLMLGVLFFVVTWEVLGAAWTTFQHFMMPADWAEADWYRWLFVFSPYGVALQFGTGVAAYQITKLKVAEPIAGLLSNAGLIGLVVIHAIYASGAVPQHYFQEGMWASLATAVLMIGARADGIANRILSGRVIVYIGTISYSLYLFHFVAPPITLHGRHFEAYTQTAALFHGVNFLGSLGLAIAIATGIYHLIEVPGRRAIRAAANRLLGIASPRPTIEGTPAE